MQGKLYLVPSTLGSESTKHVIPSDVIEIVKPIRFFAVEEIKSARRLLRKMDREFPIDESTFFILKKGTPIEELLTMIQPLKEGHHVAIISEAGCPCIADPGGNLVALAHENGHWVAPLVGPSSILLSLIGSGFNGQSFTFHGYLPRERKDRIRKMKEFETNVRRTNQTQLFMDTPYRNMHVLEDMLNELMDDTYLCIACDLTNYEENIRTMKIKEWREHAYDLSKRPVIFILGKPN
jgi:16S rRNA (cytidine1402-2'-O)-methyltransferase